MDMIHDMTSMFMGRMFIPICIDNIQQQLHQGVHLDSRITSQHYVIIVEQFIFTLLCVKPSHQYAIFSYKVRICNLYHKMRSFEQLSILTFALLCFAQLPWKRYFCAILQTLKCISMQKTADPHGISHQENADCADLVQIHIKSPQKLRVLTIGVSLFTSGKMCKILASLGKLPFLQISHECATLQ